MLGGAGQLGPCSGAHTVGAHRCPSASLVAGPSASGARRVLTEPSVTAREPQTSAPALSLSLCSCLSPQPPCRRPTDCHRARGPCGAPAPPCPVAAPEAAPVPGPDQELRAELGSCAEGSCTSRLPPHLPSPPALPPGRRGTPGREGGGDASRPSSTLGSRKNLELET